MRRSDFRGDEGTISGTTEYAANLVEAVRSVVTLVAVLIFVWFAFVELIGTIKLLLSLL